MTTTMNPVLVPYIARFDREGRWFLSAQVGQQVSRYAMARTAISRLEWREEEDSEVSETK